MNRKGKGRRQNKNMNRKQRRRRRNPIYKRPYILKQGVQTLGIGGTTYRFEQFFNVTVQAGSYQNSSYGIIGALNGNLEFQGIAQNYKYFKILGVKVVLPPQPTVGNSTIYRAGRIAMDWNDLAEEELMINDSAKVIPFYSVRNTIYTFRPPNMNLRTVVGDSRIYNYREFIPLNYISGNMPGWLKGTFPFNIKFHTEIIVLFKTNETQVVPNTKEIKLTGTVKSFNIEEEKEEEENKDQKPTRKIHNERNIDPWQVDPEQDEKKPRWTSKQKRERKEKEKQNQKQKDNDKNKNSDNDTDQLQSE